MTASAPALCKVVSQRLRELARYPSIELESDFVGNGWLIIWKSAASIANPPNWRVVAPAATLRQMAPLLAACRAELARLREAR